MELRELQHCPACHATGRSRWYANKKIQLWICSSCGLGYSDPQPLGLVEQRYLETYDLAKHSSSLEARKGVLIERRLDTLPKPRPGQKLLDVGCGDGQFASAAMARGWTAEGVELNPPAAQKARERGVTVMEGHLEGIEFGTDVFELVTAWDVIEHLPDPAQFVRKLVEAVAPGGTIIVTTLNRRSMASRTFRGRWSMVIEDHFTYWDRSSLTSAFAEAGAGVTDLRSYGLGRDFVAWIDRWKGSAHHQAEVDGEPAHSAESPPKGQESQASRWDVSAVVLGVEQMVNHFLNLTQLGVEIEATIRAPTD